ncbi:uncharacterized protein LOC119668924 [Teleopsis dalmanni]|uniref:uncharacterized protein LOC119668924 n=1 Tax=Teleopsis dalmanni TaxID=139649 RepID=UPI0018CF22ED|nr:uncharacterized protein LOC119668924 [Teleopsis dalmanni]
MVKAVNEELPNLPLELHVKNRYRGFRLNTTCAPYPEVLEIQFHNNFYQHYSNKNITFELFAAYYDNRTDIPKHPVVRIFAMINQIEEKFNTNYCQFWFESQKEPVIVPITEYLVVWIKGWGNKFNHLYPHMLTCILPKEKASEAPRSISIVNKECDKATNHLKVIYEPPLGKRKKGGFAVCVKGFMFPFADISARLVEWMEMMRILGAQEVIAYSLAVHPNATKVIDYYKKKGFLRVYPYSYARGEPVFANFQRYIMKEDYLNMILNEMFPYNDCFYRNIYKYDYVAGIDIDEVIMPLGNWTSWYDIVEYGEKFKSPNCKTFAGICFRNTYYPKYEGQPPYSTDIPNYFYMLQHVKRIEKHMHIGFATKCLHNTKYALTLHNHYSLGWLGCRNLDMNATDAQLQHYREPDDKNTLNLTIMDPNIWRFKDNLIKRTMRVFEDLDFFKDTNTEN